jgi:hypothetical protein
MYLYQVSFSLSLAVKVYNMRKKTFYVLLNFFLPLIYMNASSISVFAGQFYEL